ncbi:MAG: hypothetical protein ACRCZ0_11405 [Cetobacterium sp.]
MVLASLRGAGAALLPYSGNEGKISFVENSFEINRNAFRFSDDFEEDDVSISDVSAPGAFSYAGKCAQCDVLFHVLLTYHSELTDAKN